MQAARRAGRARRWRLPWGLEPEEEWRRNLYFVMVAVFVLFTGFTFVIPFLPLYVTQLGVTDPGDAALWSGVIFGISPLIAGLLAPVWTTWAERYGRKPIMLRAAGSFVVLIAAMAFVTNVYQLFGLRLLIGVFGGFSAMSVALASTIAPRDRVGEAIGLIQATQLASGIGAPFLGGLVVDAVGLKGSFFLASALCLVGFLLIAFGYHEDREASAEGTRGQGAGKTPTPLRHFLRLPVFVGMLVAIFTIQFIDRSFGPLLPLYVGTLGAPAARIGSISGLVVTLGALGGSIAAIGAGRLSTRFSPRRLLLASLAAGALTCLPIAFVSHWWQLLLWRTLLGLLAGGSLTLTYAIGGRALPPEAKLTAYGALAGVGMIGGAISPQVTGLLSKYASLRTIFVVDTVLYAVVLVWAWWMLRTRPESPAAPIVTPTVTTRAATGDARLAPD